MASQGGVPPMLNQGPPYIPMTWGLGGTSKVSVDVPITAIFLFLYILGAAIHMTIFQLNRRRGHKFLVSIFLFGFCMARIITSVLRIASTSVPHNVRLAIAAQIFVAAGVLIIFIINLIFAQRLVRSLHPRLGWHPAYSSAHKITYVLIMLTLAIVITATVQSFYTLRPRTRTIDRSLQLYGSTFLATISILPIPIVLIALLVPRKSPPEKFGAGRLRTKVVVLLTGTTLLCLGAAFRCGTSWKKPVARTQPLPDYFHKACFYVFNFVLEILVVYMYAIMRVDLRFHIPDGAKGQGSYEAGTPSRSTDGTNDGEAAKEKRKSEGEASNGNTEKA
ncbi:hypothetical protein K469DRAFT_684962 [Zopfia rhizophila CBS 207.26]|uniref:Family c-likeg-protein-coupled receptor protein n=1 Tax=Zopfia rhizophila CBS 207.26 TaxID=1314779 RepID=A0A6A6ECD9_9PEZI|nr:hypothetical protein K469DRAFT_684962 [Zopfia rhizophila CBS 207.26]